MNLIKTLSHLGFQPSDYILSGSDFSMVQKFVEVESEQVDVTPAKPSAEQLQSAWEEVQLKELDIAMLIEEYLSDKSELRDMENDCLNIVDGLIHSWSFANIAKPSNAQLLALKDEAQTKQSQREINEEALKYLADTDWMVLRSMDGIPVPEEVVAKRIEARSKVIR